MDSNTNTNHKPIRTADSNHAYIYRGVPVFKTKLSFAKWVCYHETIHSVSGDIERTRAFAMTLTEMTAHIDMMLDRGCYEATPQGLRITEEATR